MAQEIIVGAGGGGGLAGTQEMEQRRAASEEAARGWIGRTGLSALEVGHARAVLAQHRANLSFGTLNALEDTIASNPTGAELRRRALEQQAREDELQRRADQIAGGRRPAGAFSAANAWMGPAAPAAG